MFVLPDPPLSEAEVRLRAFDHRDTDPIAKAYADREVLRWFWPETGERSATAFLHRQDEAWRRSERAGFAVCECDGSCVGAVFLEARGGGICDIGYWLLPEGRGKGLAARATRLVAEWALRSRVSRVSSFGRNPRTWRRSASPKEPDSAARGFSDRMESGTAVE
jgi:RimJ/RimL family protein N-acetyltransferase